MAWYQNAMAALTELAAAVQQQRAVRLDRVQELAVELVSSLKRNDELVVAALSSPPGSPLITNLVNVAILAAKVGIGLGYYGKELERLALGGLVHDVGIFAVPQTLVTKAGRLTRDERLVIEQHPGLGSAWILHAGDEYQWLSLLVRHAHERSNGQGYPNRLRGRQISEMAQIIGVVDVFDALVSERPYRRRMLPHEAVKELLVTERATFPREILKALVEQLSVYPLGTIIRLSTGEVGTVVGVNVRYPLRPVVRVDEQERAGGPGGRQIDLSLTPLVTIVDILDPPAVGRLAFQPGNVMTTSVSAPHEASDQFTAMLESLDAIASAIQGVIDTRTTPSTVFSQEGGRSGEGESPLSRMGTRSDHTFQKEVIGLFALEAREWLGQIRSALRRLGGKVEDSVRSRLYGIVLNGISNLARSAASVRLSEIEELASGLLPLLRYVGGAESEGRSDTVRPLRLGVERLAAEVQRLDSDEATPFDEKTSPGASQFAQEAAIAAPASTGVVPKVSSGPSPDQIAATRPLLTALHELQRARARSVQPARDVLEAIIQRAEQESDRQPSAIDAAVISRILRDLDRLDDEFLREVHDRVPTMIDLLSKMREEGTADFVTAPQLDPVFVHIESLYDASRTIQATTIMMFLQGIKSFLSATVYRKVAALPYRLEAVDARLQTLVPMAEQWVQLGRLERAAIEEILPS